MHRRLITLRELRFFERMYTLSLRRRIITTNARRLVSARLPWKSDYILFARYVKRGKQSRRVSSHSKLTPSNGLS